MNSKRSGMTLIELLVAMILCGIVAFIVLEMFSGEHKNYSTTKAKIKLQSDAREALRIIEAELKNAGYRTALDLSNRKELKTKSCTEGTYDAKGTTFKPLDKGIEFRTYNADLLAANRTFDCISDLMTISYIWDPSTKTLNRKYKDEAPVPFLTDVENFSIEYGLYNEDAPLLNATKLATASPAFSRNGSVAVLYDATTDSTYISGWNSSESQVWANLDVIGKLEPLATYRISFNAYASTEFSDETQGVQYLRAGFFTTSGSRTIDTFSFRPGSSAGAGGVRAIQYDLVTREISSPTNVTFGIEGKLKADITGASLSITNIKVTRLNSGKITDWISDPTSATDWSKVKSIKLTLSVKDSKDNIINYTRTAAVVNNGQ